MVELGDCAVLVDKAVYTDRVGGYVGDLSHDIQHRLLAVTLTVTRSNGAWCDKLFNPGLVSHPTYINKPNDFATALASPNLDIFNISDGPVTATHVFDVGNDDQPYLIFTDSRTNHIRFDLGLADADSVADIAPDQPLIPLGQAAAFRDMTATVQWVTETRRYIAVELNLTSQSIESQRVPDFYLLDGAGLLVKPLTKINPFDKWLDESESITGSLGFDTDAREGSRLLLWGGGYQAPVMMSLWPT